MTFSQLGLSAPLLQALDALGYKEPTPVQAQAIPAVLAGRDLMAAAQTGTGKTAGFALPLLQRLSESEEPVASNCIRALVLVPTRELAEQVMSSFRQYGEHLAVSCYAAYGGVSLNPQMMRMRRGVDILVATPGRLIDLFTKNAVKLRQVQTLILDEADRMLDLGFANDLDIVFQALPKKRQTLLFSATFSDEIRSMAKARLRDPLSIEVTPRNTAAKTVKQWVVPCDKKRKTDLFLFMRKDRGWGQVLVFVKTKRGVTNWSAACKPGKFPPTRSTATARRPRASRRWKSSRRAKWKSLSPRTSRHAASTSTTCRRWSITTCPSSPKTISTVSAAPVVPAPAAKRSRSSAPTRRRCSGPSKPCSRPA